MKRVAVLYGGTSSEREVSLVSGKAVVNSLRENGYDAYPVEISDDVASLVAALEPRPDAVFNALHGRYGEDGCVQGVLELLGLPYTHSGVLASALAMNKPFTKRVVDTVGVRTPTGRVIPRAALADGHPLPTPYVIKPIGEGSTVGVRVVRMGENRPPVIDDWTFGDDMLVEEYIAGHELTVGIMGDRALDVTEIRFAGQMFDYTQKYTPGHAQHVIPAQVPAGVREEAMRAALLVHQTLGCAGISRSDFRYDDTKPGTTGLYFLEINTQPGFTPISLVPEQAQRHGISFGALCSWLVEQARCHG
jgi:D-alanine-D-alanine ligase